MPVQARHCLPLPASAIRVASGGRGDIRNACRGDPVHNETQAAYMLKYSPLDNVRPQAYPHMLASGGAHI